MKYEDVEINSERWFDLTPLLNEEFRDIKDYESFYQISNYGRVKSLSRKINSWNGYKNCEIYINEKILKCSFDKDKYLICTLNKEGKHKWSRVHILVAQAFIPNPNNLPQVNHKDGIKQNPKVCNLEWCTNQENRTHAKIHGLVRKGRKLAVYNEQETKIYNDIKDFAEKNNLSYGMSKYYIYIKKKWQNYNFKFINDKN